MKASKTTMKQWLLLLILSTANAQLFNLRASGGDRHLEEGNRQLQPNVIPMQRVKRFPKKRCEGDCDGDNQCARGLVCYPRRGGEDVSDKGCARGNAYPSMDVCVPDPRHRPQQQQGRPPQQQGRPEESNREWGGREQQPPSASSTNSFRLKMYYRDDYCWQDECHDPEWCAFYNYNRDYCYYNNDDQGPCRPDQLYVDKCDRRVGDNQFQFREAGEKILVQANNNMCLQRMEGNIHLRPCNEENANQRWDSPRGSFRGQNFEFSIDGWNCMTQHHHPKARELIELEPCRPERDTTLWEKVYGG